MLDAIEAPDFSRQSAKDLKKPIHAAITELDDEIATAHENVRARTFWPACAIPRAPHRSLRAAACVSFACPCAHNFSPLASARIFWPRRTRNVSPPPR
eukprot:scaffold143265_cov33-Tisochrysis_lutea.AAC.4